MDENMEYWNEIYEIEEEEEELKPVEESKVSWMMKKGWNIGKKVMITGATISSAPIVLPPLMIYSTIGFAFAVPFGFVFGSYACTEKLMSKLLWRPEYDEQYQGGDAVEEEDGGYYGEGTMRMDEEERRFIEDTKGTLESRIEFVEPVKVEEVKGDEEMGASIGGGGGGGGNSFEEGEILENVYRVGDIVEEDNLRRRMEELGGNEILENGRVLPIEVIEWNVADAEVEDQPKRGVVSGEIEEIGVSEDNLDEVLEDEQERVDVNLDSGESTEEENLARERYGDVEESQDAGSIDVRVEEEEMVPLQNMKGMVRDEIEVESPLELNVDNIEDGMESLGGEVEFDEQNDLSEGIREEEIQYEVLQDYEQKIVSEFLNDGEAENSVGGMNGDVEDNGMNVAVEEEERPLLDTKEIGGQEFEEETPVNLNVEDLREGQYVGAEGVAEENVDERMLVKDIAGDEKPVYEMHPFGEERSLLDAKAMGGQEIEEENPLNINVEDSQEGQYFGAEGVTEENVDERILVKGVAGDEKPVYEMHPFGEDISSELNFDDVAQEENYIVIEEGNLLIGADQVVEGERRENEENVDSLDAKEEPLMSEKLDDKENVKAISAPEGVVIKSGDDQNVDVHKKEDMTVEEARGIRFVEETPVARETVVGEIVDDGGVVDVRKDEGVTDIMALRGKKPSRENSEAWDAREAADESGLHLYEEHDVYGDNYASESKDARDISGESGLHMYNENAVYGDNYSSETKDAREIASDSGFHLCDENYVYGDNYASAADEAHEDEALPMSTSYDSSPLDKLDSQSQTVDGSAVEEQPSDNLREEISDSTLRTIPLDVTGAGSAKESEGVVIRSGDDEDLYVRKEEEMPGIQKDNSIEESTQMARTRKDGSIVDEVRDKEVKKPAKESSGMMEIGGNEQNDAKIVIPGKSGVFKQRKDEKKPTDEKKLIRETEITALRSEKQDAAGEVADESGLHSYDKDDLYSEKYASATNGTHEDEVLPVSTPYYSSASNAALDNQSHSVNGGAVEKQTVSKTLHEEIADSVLHPIPSKVSDRGSVEEAASMKNKHIPSEQVIYSEEKIWEKIGALRKIVGYQAVMQTTCIEELKALYIFTGVEPPFAFKDPADLEEINDKLRLLMLIVGVK